LGSPSNGGCIIGTQKDETLSDKFDQNCIDAKGGNDKVIGWAKCTCEKSAERLLESMCQECYLRKIANKTKT